MSSPNSESRPSPSAEGLQQILDACFSPAAGEQNTGRALDNEHCIELLTTLNAPDGKLIAALEKRLEPAERLSAQQYSQLCFIEKLFDIFSANNRLPLEIKQSLITLRPLAAAWQLRDKLWLWSDKHPLLNTLKQIYQHAIGWQPEAGRAAERFLGNLQKLLQQQRQHWLDEGDSSEPLADFFRREQQRSEKLEKRLRDAESGVLRTARCQQFSTRFINSKMLGKKLPGPITQFLQGDWRESLKLMLAKYGEQSPEWQQLAKLTETLIWSFQPFGADETTRQRLYELIPQLQDELRANCLSLTHSGDRLNQQLSVIEAEHLKILKGETLSYDSISLINSEDVLASSTTIVSSGLSKLVEGLREQQWFIQHHGDSEVRMKLILKMDDAQQLLFCNQTGLKAAQYSFNDFAYQLSSKNCEPLPTRNPLRQARDQLLSKLQQALQQQQARLQQHAEEIEQQQQQLAARQQRDKELREAARAKALAEAEQLAVQQQQAQQAQLQAQREAEQQRRNAVQQAEEKADRQRLKHHQLDVARLNTGSRIEFRDEQGEITLCKLAVKMQSSGKLIFVDASGLKNRELKQPQLLEQVLDGSARIIDQGADFEDTLAQVVNGLRKGRRLE